MEKKLHIAELESIAKRLEQKTRIHEPSAKKITETLYAIASKAVAAIAPQLSEEEIHEKAIKIVCEGTQNWGLDHGLKADDHVTIAERSGDMGAYVRTQAALLIEHILRGGNRSPTSLRRDSR